MPRYKVYLTPNIKCIEVAKNISCKYRPATELSRLYGCKPFLPKTHVFVNVAIADFKQPATKWSRDRKPDFFFQIGQISMRDLCISLEYRLAAEQTLSTRREEGLGKFINAHNQFPHSH